MKYLILIILIFYKSQGLWQAHDRDASNYDIIIYGGTSAGITAAVQASRMGKSVLLLEPGERIGGLTTGGLGQTDIGNKQAIGGISREFYERIFAYYEDPKHWIWQDKESYKGVVYSRTQEGEKTRWTFEPSVALRIFEDMIEEQEYITVKLNQKLDRVSGVVQTENRIQHIRTLDGAIYSGRIFIDATYEGDLMASAGVSYTIGRESNSTYNESLNGVQANFYNVSLRGKVSKNAVGHNLLPAINPYIVQGDPNSGLLPGINPDKPGIDGSGDSKIQAYCFRMCLTDHPENRIPFSRPQNYDELEYELLFRNYEAAQDLENMYSYGSPPYIPWANSAMPNRKTDTNNKHGFSTDYIGQNYNYPEASYEEREKITENHRNYQKGLMWTLAYHPRIPDIVRNEVSKWGTCKDEFGREDGWPEQLYVREARRMISDYVMNQHHCEGLMIAEDPIGLAAYGMDSHHVQRCIDANGYVQNEGNVECRVAGPFPISYRAIIPGSDETDNLLVPVCLSASHIAFGSIRMEPVFMVLGQSAAIAAVLSIDRNCKVQELPYEVLEKELMKYKQRIK